MGSRVTESGGVTAGVAPTTELLVGADYVPTDTSLPKQHYVGYGTAGFRLQHPEGGDQTNPYPDNPAGTSDFTENRWFRLLGFVEVPTRSHRGLNESTPNAPSPIAPYQVAAGSINGSLGFYRTPGKININTLRYPDIVAGMVGEPDIFNMNFTPTPLPIGQNLPAGLQVPYLLQSIDPTDTVAVLPPQNPDGGAQTSATGGNNSSPPATASIRCRSSTGERGSRFPACRKSAPGVTIPSARFSGSIRRIIRSARTLPWNGLLRLRRRGRNGYNGPLESNLLRSLSGDAVTTGAGTFDLRRRLFELGTNAEHVASKWDYATKQRLLSRLVGNTTTRSNIFFVWIQVDFFQAKDVGPSLSPADTGVVRIGAKLGTSPGYRGFFVIDRSQALPLVTSQYLPQPPTTGQPFVFSFNQSFNYQSLILYRQRIQ